MFASKCQLLSERSTSTQQLTATSKCDNPTSTLNGPGRLPALASSLFHTCHCHTLFSMSQKSNWQNKNLRELLNRGWWIETKKINKVNASWKLLAYSGNFWSFGNERKRTWWKIWRVKHIHNGGKADSKIGVLLMRIFFIPTQTPLWETPPQVVLS